MAFSNIYCMAFGIGTRNQNGEWLEVFYPAPMFNPSEQDAKLYADALGYDGGNRDIELDEAKLSALASATSDPQQQDILSTLCSAFGGQSESNSRSVVACFLETDEAIQTTPEAYLKLHLLSLRHVKPHDTDLTGIFAMLPNVAWTNEGAVDLSELTSAQLKARTEGRVLEVSSIDKFPRMANYVVPAGVRIAHTARVRLGAYLGEGTTVMHEGFVNFNAGTLGTAMVEGRLSQGVVMGEGSDLGGGASTMGTLSGGNDIIVSVGKDCLIGANAGCGIPLGDRCTIEAGLYITGGTVIQVMDENRNFLKVVKARELAGQSEMLFIRNSQTGSVECRTNTKAIALNESLHAHN